MEFTGGLNTREYAWHALNLRSHGKGRKVLEFHDLLPVAVGAAEGAAAFVRDAKAPADPAAWGRKGLKDFVTEVDREAERMVASHLLAKVPDSQVRGEELSPDTDTDDLVWIVDPLDGTTNFLHGFPAYAVSVAGVYRGIPRVGVIVDVVRRITYSTVAGGGASAGDAPMNVSRIADPGSALIGTGFPFKAMHLLPEYLEQFAHLLRHTTGIRRAGSAALDLVDVALGRFDGFWELQLAPWDVAAGVLLVREAGGIVTDAAGSPDVLKHGSIVAGNPHIQPWLLKAIEQPETGETAT
jgi:myo-inositol-1(or 4)-monophosphatase